MPSCRVCGQNNKTTKQPQRAHDADEACRKLEAERSELRLACERLQSSERQLQQELNQSHGQRSGEVQRAEDRLRNDIAQVRPPWAI